MMLLLMMMMGPTTAMACLSMLIGMRRRGAASPAS
jgi:hypothetical protein